MIRIDGFDGQSGGGAIWLPRSRVLVGCRKGDKVRLSNGEVWQVNAVTRDGVELRPPTIRDERRWWEVVYFTARRWWRRIVRVR